MNFLYRFKALFCVKMLRKLISGKIIMRQIRDAVEADFQHIIDLNQSEVLHTSPMDWDNLDFLRRMSDFCKVVEIDQQVAAFIIALRNDQPYKNVNYEWFAARYSSFLYVDRVVVGSDFSGQLIGSFLYQNLFAFAQVQDIEVIACEYNIKPPNLPSRAFHDKFGFKEVGQQHVADGTKLVSLQVAQVKPPAEL